MAISLDTQPLHTLIIAFLGSIRNCKRKSGSMVDDDLHGGNGGDEDPLSIQFWRSPLEYRELPGELIGSLAVGEFTIIMTLVIFNPSRFPCEFGNAEKSRYLPKLRYR